MRFSIAIAALIPLAFAKTSYKNWKAYSIDTAGSTHDEVVKALKGINHIPIGEHHDTIEVAVDPKSLDKFEGLDLNVKLFINDMDEEFAKEGSFEELSGQ